MPIAYLSITSFLSFIFTVESRINAPFLATDPATLGRMRDDGSVISYSGPTNALFGHEVLTPVVSQVSSPLERRRRRRGNFYSGNGFNNNNYQGPAAWANNLATYIEPLNDYSQMWAVSEHNRYRRMVPATDMRMIYWSDKLAASAQAHANTCDFRHSRNRVNIGENIWAAPYTNYTDAIARWFNEVHDPMCGCNHAYKHCCGHYIQVVWARTNLVGCGYAQCSDVQGVLGMGHRAVFVCHYSPQGNRVYVGSGQLVAVPAFTWAMNPSEICSGCPPDAPACHQGLCYMPAPATQSYSDEKKQTKSAAGKATKAELDKGLNTNSIVRV